MALAPANDGVTSGIAIGIAIPGRASDITEVDGCGIPMPPGPVRLNCEEVMLLE